VLNLRNLVKEAAVRVLSDSENHGVRLERLQLPGRLRPAVLVELHHFDREVVAVDRLDRSQPLDLDTFSGRFVGLEFGRGHVNLIAAIDDEGLGRSQTLHGSGGVHRRVAAAIDDDSAAQDRVRAGCDIAQQRNRVEHFDGVAGRDFYMLRQMRADRNKDCVEAACRLFLQHVLDL